MPVTLTIDFIGLQALVIDKNELLVLMVGAGAHHHGGHHGSTMPAHVPRLVTELSSVALGSGSFPPTELVAVPRSRAELAVWDIAGYELTVKGQAERPSSLQFYSGQRKADVRSPRTKGEADDVSWIPDMETVCGSGRLKPELLGEDPPRELVTGRARLTGGTITPGRFARVDGDPRSTPWFSFEPEGEVPYIQAIADVVRYTFKTDDVDVTLSLRPLSGASEREEPLEIVVPRERQDEVTFTLTNFPSDVSALDPAGHFDAFYDLLAEQVKERRRPSPVGGFQAPDPFFCSQARFTG